MHFDYSIHYFTVFPCYESQRKFQTVGKTLKPSSLYCEMQSGSLFGKILSFWLLHTSFTHSLAQFENLSSTIRETYADVVPVQP